MRDVLFREIAQPLFRRSGTLIAGVLVAQGIHAETVAIIEAGVVASLFVSLDLTLSYLNRKRGKQ